MSRPSAVTLVGALATLLGLAIVAGAVGVPFGLRASFVTLVGLLAFVQGARYALVRRSTTLHATEVDDPERRHRVPVPGDDLDERLAVPSGWYTGRVTTRQRVRDRLRAAAVETLVCRENCPESRAERLVDGGDWTADRVAAAFLAGDPPPLSLRRRLALFVRSESIFEHAAGRTIAAIVALQGGEGAVSGDAGATDGGDADDSGRPDARERLDASVASEGDVDEGGAAG